MPATTPATPHRTIPRPKIIGSQIALIAGPSGEEIFCGPVGPGEGMVPVGSARGEGRVRHLLDARRPAVGGHDVGPPGDPACGDGMPDLLPGGRPRTAPSSPPWCRTRRTPRRIRCPTTRRGWYRLNTHPNKSLAVSSGGEGRAAVFPDHPLWAGRRRARSGDALVADHLAIASIAVASNPSRRRRGRP